MARISLRMFVSVIMIMMCWLGGLHISHIHGRKIGTTKNQNIQSDYDDLKIYEQDIVGQRSIARILSATEAR